MNIMELGAIGELVGGVAVIGSLIYVGMQIRQSNKNERAAVQRHFLTEWNRTILDAFADRDSASVVRRAHRNFSTLDGEEQAAAHAFWTKAVMLAQEAHFQLQQGRFERRFAEVIEATVVQTLRCPGTTQWWAVAGKTFTPEFSRRLSEKSVPTTGPSLEQTLPWLIADQEA